jgi:hypothetical protein
MDVHSYGLTTGRDHTATLGEFFNPKSYSAQPIGS